MSLRYILGNTGSGKTTLCIKEIIEKDELSNHLIYIVPEQYTLGAENELLKAKSEKIIMSTNVFSFKRLAHEIISSVGNNKKTLGDIGKLILLKKLALKAQNKLRYYNRAVNKSGFIVELASTVTELSQYSASSEDILNAAMSCSEDNPISADKLNDIALIFDMYNQYIEDKYISQEGLLDILAELIPQTDFFDNCEIWIDGFVSFTPQEKNVIARLLKKACRINIALTITPDKINSKLSYDVIHSYDSFAEVMHTLTDITKQTLSDNIAIEPPVILASDWRHISKPDLAFIAENALKMHPQTYNNELSAISVVRADDKYKETDYVCSKIKELVSKNAYRYGEIAIITESSQYDLPLSCSLDRYEIPNFLDSRQSLTSHPLIIIIKSILSIVANGWQSEDILRLFKTGYTPVAPEDIWTIESYVDSTGVTGKRFWTGEKTGYGFGKYSRFKPAEIDRIRKKIMEVISPFTAHFGRGKKNTVKEISVYLFDFLYSIKATSHLDKIISDCSANGDEAGVRLNTQIWDIVLEIFEKMTELLGDEYISAADYSSLASTGIDNSTVGLIPPLQDHIIIGDISRTRLPDIKALFIVGLNEGILPPHRVDDGLINDDDKNMLDQYGVRLSPDTMRKISQDNLSIYRALCTPSDFLCLTYSSMNNEGKQLSPSSIINKLTSIFPALTVQSAENTVSNINSFAPAINMLINKLAENKPLDSEYKTLLYYLQHSDYSSKLTKILSAGIEPDTKLNNADLIYKDGYTSSISQLEKYASCPMSFFINYTLDVKGESSYLLESNDKGNLMHYSLEYISNKVGRDWSALYNKESELIGLVNEAVSDAQSKLGKEYALESSRYSYVVERTKNMLYPIVYSIAQQYTNTSHFVPGEYELSFSENGTLPPIAIDADNKHFKLIGKIDKFDYLISENDAYLKIVDYKSSKKTLDPTLIYNGIQLQLLMYIKALTNSADKLEYLKEKNIHPGAALFMNLRPNNIEYGKQYAGSLFTKYKYSGIILDSQKVLQGIDAYSTDKNGDYTLNSNRYLSSTYCITERGLNSLMDFSYNKCTELLKGISSGDMPVSPYKYTKNYDSCTYCSYSSICQKNISDIDKHRLLSSLELSDIVKEK